MDEGTTIVDALLDIIENALTTLIDEHELFRFGLQLERWRWNQPIIVLSWTDTSERRDSLNRNITAHVEGEPSFYTIAVEVNAWVDHDDMRHWNHLEIGQLNVAAREWPTTRSEWFETLNDKFHAAYNTVTAWNLGYLRRVAPLPPFSVETVDDAFGHEQTKNRTAEFEEAASGVDFGEITKQSFGWAGLRGDAPEIQPEVGEIYLGKVVRIMPYGAFVQILPGKDGLVHISELADYRVRNVRDVVDLGDEINVMVTDVDRHGRVSLSRKAVLMAEMPPLRDEDKHDRPRRQDIGKPPKKRAPAQEGRSLHDI